VHLTGKEYQMLELLSLRKGTTLTKEMFLNHLYGGMDEPELKIIDVFICKLRKKLANRHRRQELHRNRLGPRLCAARAGQIIVKSGLKNFILIAKIQIKGFAPVSFYALHTPPPLRSWFFEQRNAELDHAASIINYNHKDRNSNIVLLGDWNITPYSPFFSRLLESTGFKNQTMSRFFLPTWPAQYYSFFQIPIDHILHRGNMTLIDKRRGPSLGSDHHAVVAVYQLEPDARKKNEP
jgi:endonuclease/exonuclease/phosphatase (EEP) superfamily protein YafD